MAMTKIRPEDLCCKGAPASMYQHTMAPFKVEIAILWHNASFAK